MLNKIQVVVLVDYFSDFWEVAMLNNTMSTSIIEFCKQQFSRHGIPDILIFDNGPQLKSSEFTEFIRTWQFTHVMTSPYHSQSNRKVESAEKIVKSIIKKVSTRQKRSLVVYIWLV